MPGAQGRVAPPTPQHAHRTNYYGMHHPNLPTREIRMVYHQPNGDSRVSIFQRRRVLPMSCRDEWGIFTVAVAPIVGTTVVANRLFVLNLRPPRPAGPRPVATDLTTTPSPTRRWDPSSLRAADTIHVTSRTWLSRTRRSVGELEVQIGIRA